MKMSRIRPDLVCFVYAFITLAFGSLSANAQAPEYEFTPLVTAPGVAINSFNPTTSVPTINNSGVVAYRDRVAAFIYNVVLIDGSSTTTIDLNAASGFGALFAPRRPFINDSGAVAVGLQQASFGGPTPGSILRINPDGFVTTLATTHLDGVSGDFTSVQGFAMNNAGQVAAKVLLNSGVNAIVLLDDSAQTVIDTEDPAVRFSFSDPAINDDGVVAYKAGEPAPNFVSVFTGDGVSPVQLGLPLPSGCGGIDADPDINNNGLMAGQHPDCLVVGSGGVVTEVIVDEATNPFATSIGRLSLNDLDQIVFVASTTTDSTGSSGLYFGDDPVNDKLIDVGDSLFGETVGNPTGIPFCCGQPVRFAGEGGFNDDGQVVFLASTVSESNVVTSYLIRADLKDAPDNDGDGVVDDVDNCTLDANADQRDTDSDGHGNRCDGDLNQDCIVNPVDLGIFRSVFFNTGPGLDGDFNGDDVINPVDLGIFRSLFFAPPGPSPTGSLCNP